jgi:hypothetical protein
VVRQGESKSVPVSACQCLSVPVSVVLSVLCCQCCQSVSLVARPVGRLLHSRWTVVVCCTVNTPLCVCCTVNIPLCVCCTVDIPLYIRCMVDIPLLCCTVDILLSVLLVLSVSQSVVS